jgi:hypothetical protein
MIRLKDILLEQKDETRSAAVKAVRKVFGSKTGMLEKDMTIGGQRQIWIDVTHPATSFQAQQDFERWQRGKLNKVRNGIRREPALRGFKAVFREKDGDISIVLVS